jgi:hypothetical protein
MKVMGYLITVLFCALFGSSAAQVEVGSIEAYQVAIQLGEKDLIGTGEWHGNIQLADGVTLTGKGLVIHGWVTAMDVHGVKLHKFKVVGGVELNDSYPEKGLRDVELSYLTIHGTGARGIFMGGHNIEGINIHHCVVLYNVGGTHNGYLTGAHWDPSWGPVKDVRVAYCLFGYTPGGRNNLQFNGRFDGGIIEWNTFQHAQLNGITLIGCQNFVVRHNVSYGHNRGSGIVIYDYASHWKQYYNNFMEQSDIDAFRACHWPCRNVKVIRNTFFVGPKQFSVDPYHSDDPQDGHPVILINNGVHSGFTIYEPGGIEDAPAAFDWRNPPEPDWYNMEGGLDEGGYVQIPRPGQEFNYPSGSFIIRNNILASPKPKMVEIYHPHEAAETNFDGNMVWCYHNGIPYVVGYEHLKSATGNLLMDPKFIGGHPVYGFVDLGVDPEYDWTGFETKFNPFTWRGKKLKKGKPFPVIPMVPGDIDEALPHYGPAGDK